MSQTLLTELIRNRASISLLGVFSRTVDKVVEEMAQDLLRDPEFRKEMQDLIHTAFRQALKELNEAKADPS